MNSTSSRVTRISTRKVALMGAAYTKTWIGTRVVCTTYEGERIVGTITDWRYGYPVATFEDGTWMRLGERLEVVTP